MGFLICGESQCCGVYRLMNPSLELCYSTTVHARDPPELADVVTMSGMRSYSKVSKSCNGAEDREKVRSKMISSL
jgi:hypothetical protein